MGTSHHVVALAYHGLCTFEFGVAVEVFGLPRPEMEDGWYRFSVAALEPGELTATGGFRMVAEYGLECLETADTIVIPGWRGPQVPVPQALCDALCAAHRRGARLLSICSGVYVLAAAGLLDGKNATTHWRYADDLATRYPQITVHPRVLYIDEGNVLTSAGSAAGLDLCLHVVRKDFGLEAANRVARRLVLAPHRDGGQAQFIERPVSHDRETQRLNQLFDYLRQHLGQEHSVASLAARIGMSQRTLLRRFTSATGATPARWLLNERLYRARELLESTRLSVEQVAEQCGFRNASVLRHHFRARFSVSPASYRKNFTPAS
ncbi:transcriptional regulator FtrA [Entomohabitans teleogrylli]|uniref:transcriptional regulator FtrA n=1 Tax=Entomohabitans teleogrylli TaxID=1384589 RepID=UPI00073D2461|nr:transcriptional regulator FtrA [Entomohabitans teleogrylli]